MRMSLTYCFGFESVLEARLYGKCLDSKDWLVAGWWLVWAGGSQAVWQVFCTVICLTTHAYCPSLCMTWLNDSSSNYIDIICLRPHLAQLTRRMGGQRFGEQSSPRAPALNPLDSLRSPLLPQSTSAICFSFLSFLHLASCVEQFS